MNPLNFGTVGKAVLLAVAILWIKEMVPRWRSDFDEFRGSDSLAEKAVIAGLWGVTFLWARFLIAFLIDLLRRFGAISRATASRLRVLRRHWTLSLAVCGESLTSGAHA
jgi:hypothetical protein